MYRWIIPHIFIIFLSVGYNIRKIGTMNLNSIRQPLKIIFRPYAVTLPVDDDESTVDSLSSPLCLLLWQL